MDLRVLRYPSMIGGSLYSVILGMGLYGIMFAVPVFAQDYLHYTALQSGLILVPGAIASAAAMVFYGKIAHRIPDAGRDLRGGAADGGDGHLADEPESGDGRGAALLAAGLPRAGRGADVHAVEPGDAGAAAEEGYRGGVGILQPYPAARQQHRDCVHHHDAGAEGGAAPGGAGGGHHGVPAAGGGPDPDADGSFTAHGGDPALGHRNALELVDRIVNGQAALLSYRDIFFYVAVLFVLSLPLVLLLGGKSDPAAEEAASAAH